MSRKLITPVAVTLMFAAAPATAQQIETPEPPAESRTYVAGSIGYVFPESFESNVGVEAETKDGYAITGAIGRSFGAFRGEIEASYRTADVGEARGFGLTVPGSGDVSALSAMANVYLDPALEFGPLQPYFGGGVGISRFEANNVAAVSVPGVGPVSGLGPINGSKTGFAYQLMGGIGFALSDRTTLTAGYRYFATPNVETTVAPIGDVRIDGLGLHTVEVGLRFGF